MSASKKIGKHDHAKRRRQLIAIAKSVGVENPGTLRNHDIIAKIAARRPIKKTGAKQTVVTRLIEWFMKNEPDALRTPKNKHDPNKPHSDIGRSEKDAFYRSWEWRRLRMEVIKDHGLTCMCCGAKKGDLTVGGAQVRIVVDHIKPLGEFWNLRLERSNLQVLCDECNMGKGSWDETDWRDEGSILDDEPMTLIEQQLGRRMH